MCAAIFLLLLLLLLLCCGKTCPARGKEESIGKFGITVNMYIKK